MFANPHTQSFVQFTIVAFLFFGLGLFLKDDVSLAAHANSNWLQRRRTPTYDEALAALNPNERVAVLSLERYAAEATRYLGLHYDSDIFRRISREISVHAAAAQHSNSLGKRRLESRQGPLGAIGDLLGGAVGGTAGGNGSSLLDSLGSALSGGISSIGNTLVGALGGPALFLGIGLGMGSATGLNLTTSDQAQLVASKVATDNGMDSSGLNGAAMNLGNGLTAEVVPLISSANLSFGDVLAPASYALAQGLGNGTASGLNLTQARFSPSNGTNISDVAGNFGLGLVEPIARSINLTQVMGSLTSGGGSLMGNIDIASVLEGAGRGLGEGASQGLGIEKSADEATRVRRAAADTSGMDITGAVEGFTKGLSSSFLGNTNISAITDQGLGSGIQIPKVAEGFARGLVDGAVSGVSSAGGIDNLISGNVSRKALVTTEQPDNSFNDSVNGASVAFARGLANSGVVLIGGMIGKSLNGQPLDDTVPQKRSVDRAKGHRLSARATDPIINATLLSSLTQKGVDTLQCDGIGGFGSIGLGLFESGAISIKTLTSFKLSNSTTSFLPTEPSNITLDGNQFTFGFQSLNSIKINGLSVIAFAILTVLHIILSSIGYFFALPTFLILGAAQRISVLMDKPVNRAKSEKWQKISFLVFLGTASVGNILGIVGMGNSRQFRTPHGILGLVVTLFTFASGVTYLLRARSSDDFANTVDRRIYLPFRALIKNPPRLSLPVIDVLLLATTLNFAQIVFVLGFNDLRSVTLCFTQALITLPIAISLGTGSLTVMTSAVALIALLVWMERRVDATSLPLRQERSIEKSEIRLQVKQKPWYNLSSREV